MRASASSEPFVGRLHDHAEVKTEKDIETAWSGRYPRSILSARSSARIRTIKDTGRIGLNSTRAYRPPGWVCANSP
jgi:hypothetical protein